MIRPCDRYAAAVNERLGKGARWSLPFALAAARGVSSCSRAMRVLEAQPRVFGTRHSDQGYAPMRISFSSGRSATNFSVWLKVDERTRLYKVYEADGGPRCWNERQASRIAVSIRCSTASVVQRQPVRWAATASRTHRRASGPCTVMGLSCKRRHWRQPQPPPRAPYGEPQPNRDTALAHRGRRDRHAHGHSRTREPGGFTALAS
jgi:hypothetical protein